MAKFNPSPSINNNKSIFSLTAILLVFGAFFVIFHLGIDIFVPQQTHASDLTDQAILVAINNERSLRNLTTLNENALLDEAAQYKASDMQARHYFAHVDPDGHYIWDKIVSLGYTPYTQLGENLAINFYDTESLVDAWMQSPEHRANILNPGFKDQGMGVSLGNVASGQYYSAITNTFGTLQAETAITQAKPAAAAKQNTAPAAQSKTVPALAPATPAPGANVPVVAIRGLETASTVPAQAGATAAPAAALGSQAATVSPYSGTQTAQAAQPATTAAGANRCIALIFGTLVLLVLGYDLIIFAKNKTEHLDKKINNVALLILALVVVGLMYWL